VFTVRHNIPGYTGRVIVPGAELDFVNGTAKTEHLNAATETVLTAVKKWGVSKAAPKFPKLSNSKPAPSGDEANTESPKEA
jgi:hypothetical protein